MQATTLIGVGIAVVGIAVAGVLIMDARRGNTASTAPAPAGGSCSSAPAGRQATDKEQLVDGLFGLGKAAIAGYFGEN